MIDTGLLALIHNAALLLSMVLMFELLVRQGWEQSGLPMRIFVGALLGAIGMAVMLTPWELLPGLTFDTRSILLATSGLFFGGVPTLVAMAMTAGLRLFQGGIGAGVGVAVIVAAGLMGLLWRRWLVARGRSLAGIALWEAYGFGLAVHGAMLLFMLALPWPMALETILRIGLPVLAIYPVATLLSIVLMAGNLRNSQAEGNARAAQAALSESEARFRAIFDQAAVGIARVAPDGTWLEVNRKVCNILGYSREELLARRFQDVTHPDDLNADLHYVQQMLEGQRQTYSMEKRYRCKAGDTVWVNLTVSLMRTVDGAPKYFISVIEEIRQRKQAEAALRENEQRLRSLINSTPDIICFKDGAGRWLEANDADLELFALTQVAYRGKTDAELATFTHPIYRQAFLNCVETDERAWRTPGVSRAEERIPRPTGSEQVYDVIKVPLFETDGTRRGLIVLGREITERTHAEAALRESEIRYRTLNEALEQRVTERTAALATANRELESFTYSVSHDLRAPLRAMTGFAKALARRQRERLDAEGQHYLDNVLEAGQRMATLIENLLDYLRTGQGAVRMQPVALAPLLASLRDTFGERISAVGADLEIREPLATPCCDPTLLGQILNNLIENALIYRCREGIPRITVEALRQGEQVTISVSDNGIGIAPEDHARIFEVFQRLHDQEDYPGTGIGLAIVTKATHLMKGELGLTSALGQGSRFSVSLPACAEKASD